MNRAEQTGFALLILAGVVTVLVHPFPPTNDASSHLATAVAFRGVLQGDPTVTAFYAFDAAPLPYWLPTWLMQPLLVVFEPLLAWRVLMAAYVVVLPLSYLWLLRTAVPENAPLALLGAVSVFNWAYWLGEASFLLGLPLVFAGYALYLGLDPLRSRRLVAFVACAVATYLSHVFAVCALLGTIGMHTLLRRGRITRGQWAAAAVAGATFFAAVYFIVGSHGTDANHGELVFDFATWRLGALTRFPIGIVFASALPSVVLVAFLVVVMGRRGQPRWDLVAPGIALCALAYFGPSGIREPTGFEDIGQRFTLWGLLLILAGLAVPERPRERAVMALVLVSFGAASIAATWRDHAVYQAPAGRIAAMLPDGARLLPLQDLPTPPAPHTLQERLHRFGNHVVTLRNGYGPHVFARAGQQPMRHTRWPDYRRVRNLHVTSEEWAFYDHVLLQTDADPAAPRVPGLKTRAEHVKSTDGFQLWRIRRDRTPSE